MNQEKFFLNNLSGGMTATTTISNKLRRTSLRKIVNMQLNREGTLETRVELHYLDHSSAPMKLFEFIDTEKHILGVMHKDDNLFLVMDNTTSRGTQDMFASVAINNETGAEFSKIGGIIRGVNKYEIIVFGADIPLTTINYESAIPTARLFAFASEGLSPNNSRLFMPHTNTGRNFASLKVHQDGSYYKLIFSSAPKVSLGINTRVRVHGGEFEIVTDTNEGEIIAKMITQPIDMTETNHWSSSLLNHIDPETKTYTGAAVACWHQRRLLLCGLHNHENHLWFSKTGQGNNFYEGDGALEQAIHIYMPEHGIILETISNNGLWIKTKTGLWKLQDGALSIENISLQKVVEHECADTKSLTIDDNIVFAGSDGNIYKISRADGIENYLISNISYNLPTVDNKPMQSIAWDRDNSRLHAILGSKCYTKLGIKDGAAWSEKKIRGTNFLYTTFFIDKIIYLVSQNNSSHLMITSKIRQKGNTKKAFFGDFCSTQVKASDNTLYSLPQYYKYLSEEFFITDEDRKIIIGPGNLADHNDGVLQLNEGDLDMIPGNSVHIFIPVDQLVEALPYLPTYQGKRDIGDTLPPYSVFFQCEGNVRFNVNSNDHDAPVERIVQNKDSKISVGVKFFGQLLEGEKPLWRLSTSDPIKMQLNSVITKIR